MSRNHYRSLESGRAASADVGDLNRIAAVLGLEIALRAYPGGLPTRDAGHAGRLSRFLMMAAPPLAWRLEVPLPAVPDRWERRAWDALLFGRDERTAIELEMRVRDVQAVRRRHELKRRDDPTENFLLLVAETRHNRRVVAEFAELFNELPRLRPTAVKAALEAGRHPPTGLLFV
jgi:hypothetical protein